jgi:hypothetical protein
VTPSTSTPVPRAYTDGALRRIVLLAGIVPVVLALVGSGLMVSWAPELPNPIAIHWGAGGAPDGYGSLAGVILMLVGYVILFSGIIVASLAVQRTAPQVSTRPRLLVAITVWLATTMACGLTGLVEAQRGLTDAADTGSVVVPFALGAAAGIVLGVGAWFLTPSPALLDESGGGHTQPVIALAPNERVSWTRLARPTTKTIALSLLLIGGISLASVLVIAPMATPWTWWYVALIGLVLLASAVCFYWRVSVDHRGLLVRSGVGFPTISVPLADISATRVVDVNPLVDFGGWGWRWGGGKTGIVIRAGEAIEITRISGKTLVITVDDATTAVALLEALLLRGGPSLPPATA